MKIAILGATGHIAKSLIPYFWNDNHELYLFSRRSNMLDYKNLKNNKYDMLINCVGIGTYSNIENYYDYFQVIEYFDNMCINYLLNKSPYTMYINFSSGVVPNFDGKINQNNFYAIAKLNSEAKHRSILRSSEHDLVEGTSDVVANIIDIRLYSYFSKHVNLKDDYFINQIIKHIKENKTFVTNSEEIERDYIHPKDLYDFIVDMDQHNRAFTVGSLDTISKTEILDFFQQQYGLKVKIKDIKIPCATGSKINYYPSKIDNKPKYTSLNTVEMESQSLLMNSE